MNIRPRSETLLVVPKSRLKVKCAKSLRTMKLRSNVPEEICACFPESNSALGSPLPVGL